MRRALMVMVVTLAAAMTGVAQERDRSSPPVEAAGAGGFTVERMPGRPGIDGRAWMLADVHAGRAEAFTPPGADYEVRLSDPGGSGGVERWTVMLQRKGGAPISLTGARKTAFVYVTPDARYIFLEPLTVIDVTAWRRYDLSKALGIEPYVTIRAIRAGGRDLFLERSSCAVDCAARADEEYFDLAIPSGN